MTTTRIDYASTYFPYPTPTPIQGEPTYKSLKRLKNELQANASSVESDLGGGDHGYLGLVLTDAEYALISATPFVAPHYPAALTIPTGTDQVQALNLREKYKEDKRAYYACKNMYDLYLWNILNLLTCSRHQSIQIFVLQFSKSLFLFVFVLFLTEEA